jgi:hypothetical protein
LKEEERMRRIEFVALILFFGSLWGLSEVLGGGLLYAGDVPRASIFLSAWALLILAVARGILDRPGTSTLIGGVAALFKLINAGPFVCHLLGIFMLGVAFDAAASLFGRRSKTFSLRNSLTGILGAFGGYGLFALIITYVVRYGFWAEGGWPKVANHIFAGGGMAAVLAAALVPFGYVLGAASRDLEARRPAWFVAGAFAGVLIFWMLGPLTG